jgi:Tfp pilus assembly protein PilO
MTDTSKKALIALLGVAILVLGYMYIFKPSNEDVD